MITATTALDDKSVIALPVNLENPEIRKSFKRFLLFYFASVEFSIRFKQTENNDLKFVIHAYYDELPTKVISAIRNLNEWGYRHPH